MQQIELSSWASFKDVCITRKNLNCQFAETEKEYILYGPDSASLLWVYRLAKAESRGEEQIDFEDNHKTAFNWAIGDRPYPFSTSDFDLARDGVFGVLTPSENKLYYKIEEPGLYMNGGTMYCGDGFTFGDWAEMAIVDHDNLLGQGADFVLKQWVKKSYPAKDGKCEINTPYAGNPPQGMWIMITLHMQGTSVPTAVNLNLHRAI